MQKEFVIITAGGQGKRMGPGEPKQFMEMKGIPVIIRTIRAFEKYSGSLEFILVLPENHMGKWQDLLKRFPIQADHNVCSGGETRFESVKKGLEMIEGEGLVAVHDAVRPLVSTSLIKKCFQAAREHGSAVPVTPPSDSIREMLGHESKPVDRKKFRLVQTPQVFDVALIKKAYEQGYRNSFTDDANVVETFGAKIFLVEGERMNIKITTREDLVIAEAFLK